MKKRTLRITRADLETLEGDTWLNDNIMNAYLTLIVDRKNANPKMAKVCTFNTFFIVCHQLGYADVRRSTRGVDIFAHDILLVPVHNTDHWAMAVVDMREKKIKYVDSKGGRNDKVLAMLLKYLSQEAEDKKKNKIKCSKWKLTHDENLPRQRNCSDCAAACLH